MTPSFWLSRRPAAARRARQQGAVLLFALITLVAMLLAALALVRSVDTGTVVLGNVGFKQDATIVADQVVINNAVQWLTPNTTSLNANSTSSNGLGYYATSLSGLDATGQQIPSTSPDYPSRILINWNVDNCGSAPNGSCLAASDDISIVDANGGSVAHAKYVITRLCSALGSPTAAGNSCPQPLTGSAAEQSCQETSSYGKSCIQATAPGQYFRIIVRVTGARDTTSYTETIMHL